MAFVVVLVMITVMIYLDGFIRLHGISLIIEHFWHCQHTSESIEFDFVVFPCVRLFQFRRGLG